MSELVDWKKLAGTWYNQLGSTMHLRFNGEKGALTGEYHSNVGVPPGEWDPLAGRFDASPPSDKGVSVGWVVTYPSPANSTATWSGQYFDDGQERILTHWLLTSPTQPDHVWESTKVGTDTFIRKQPNAAEIAQARALSFGSPYLEDIIAANLRERAPLRSKL